MSCHVHLGSVSFVTNFTDAFDTPLPIGSEEYLENFADKIIELLTVIQRHHRTVGTTLPSMFQTACPYFAPRSLGIFVTTGTTPLPILSAFTAK